MRLALAVFAALATLASAADPAPAPALPPADGAPNFMYAFTTKTATFNPEKGTLTLKGLTDYAMAVATMPSGPSFSRREVGDLFGKKKRTPVFDAPAEVVIEGKKGLPSGHKLILSVSSPKMEGPGTLVFGKAVQMTGNFTAGGLAADTAARSGEGALITDAEASAAPVSVDDALVVAHVFNPAMATALEGQKAKAAKDPAMSKAAKAAAAPPADAAKPPPAKPPAPAAPDADPAKPPAPKPPAPAAPGAATPPARRRLLQVNCGVCEYANAAGACNVVGPEDCDGVTGQVGFWDCGTCQFFTQDDFEGHCEKAANC